jgi:hypothetical protein
MQRASGQYDHLARVPRTGPRQSSSRRSFASRHWRRTASRRSRGMEPTVRNPRLESAIGSESARSSLLSRRFPSAGWSAPSRNSVAGNGIFRCRDWRPRIHPRDRYCRQRPVTLKNRWQDPRRNGLFSIDDGFRGSGRLDGGDDLDQTACSPRSHRTSLRTSSQERNFLLQRRERKIRRSAS